MDALSGQTIKGYEFREKIGAGGFGAVYRAYQPILKRAVAIKVIRPDHANNPDFIRRFEVEAELVARLEHPHIVPLYDYWREPDRAYLVMRLLAGGSLRDTLKSGPLPLSTIPRILDQVSDALALAHRHQIVHRDIKPDNILLDEDANGYVTDFGIATSPDAQTTADDDTVQGSIHYIAPEQLQSAPVSPATDIYSLGFVVYELITGQHPYGRISITELVFKHLQEPLPSLLDHDPDLPAALDDVLQKATAKEVSVRYPDMRSFAAAFREAISEGAPVPIPTLEVLKEEAVELGNPYKGLRAFQEADAGEFFGREALVARLLQRLGQEEHIARFLAVVGPSGSGKSSVVKAGLIPALRWGDLPGSDKWFIVEMFPGSQPLEELEAALSRVAVNPPESLLGLLREGERGLVRALHRILPPDQETELLLVVDQFEELFTLVEDEKARAHFLHSLLTALEDPDSRLRVVVTLRADFYDRPLMYGDLAELVRKRTEIVVPLTRGELAQSIVNPAEQAGAMLEPGLVDRIVGDVGEQPGTLPLLQYALTELFEHREGRVLTLNAYLQIGGVTGALARRAEALYRALETDDKETARQLLLRLVALGEGTRDTRQRVRRSELIAGDEVDRVVNAYGTARLLTFDRDPVTREPTVEVAHEALIRNWGRMRNWIAESREALRIHRQMTSAAREWSDVGQDSSFLATGSRLAQFEAWASETDLTLNPIEQAYLEASIAEREERRRLDEARKAYELELQQRSARRLRYLAAVLLVATVGAVGLSLFAFGQRDQARENAATATVALGQEEAARATSEANLYDAWNIQALFLADLSQQELGAGAPQTALQLALRSLEHYPDIYNEESGTALLESLAYPIQETAVMQHDGGVQGTLWNADESRILSWSYDDTARVWDAQTGQELLRLPHGGGVAGAVWNADESRILSWSYDDTARVWDAQTGEQLLILRHDGRVNTGTVNGARWNAHESRILSWSDDNTARVWDARTGQPLLVLSHGTGGHREVRGAFWNADETRILTWSADWTVRVWDAHTGEQLLLIRHDNYVDGATWNADESRILSWSQDNTAQIRDAVTGDLILQLDHEQDVKSARWDADESRVITWARNLQYQPEDGSAHVWDAETGQQLFTLGYAGGVANPIWNADRTRMMFLSNDNTVRVWDTQSSEELLTLHHAGSVQGARWNQDESLILSWSDDDTARLWDADSGDPLLVMRGAQDGALWNTDETRVLTLSDDTIRIWKVGGTGEYPILRHDRAPSDAVWNTNETRILSYSNSSVPMEGCRYAVQVWTIATAEPRLTLCHDGDVRGATWNHDETRILSWSGDHTARVWDAQSGEVLLVLQHDSFTDYAMWNVDESRILSWADSSILRVWDAESGQELLALPHEGDIWGATWSHDETRILSWSDTETCEETCVYFAHVWDAQTGEELFRLPHDDIVRGGVWNADDTRFLTWRNASSITCTENCEYVVHVWDATVGEDLLTLHHAAYVWDARWNRDETGILTRADDDTLREWDAETGQERSTLHCPEGMSNLQWNADESRILFVADDDTVRLWDAQTGHERLVLHHDRLAAAQWNPGETRILSRSLDGTLRVWDAETGRDLLTLRHDGSVRGARWNADGTRILSWSSDDTVRLWIVDLETMLDIAQTWVVRDLSNEVREQFFLSTLEPTPVVSVPTVTPLPTVTPPPTSTPRPTPIAFRADDPREVMVALVQAGVVHNVQGGLSAQTNQALLDLNGEDNLIRWQPLDGLFTDFVLSATVKWGPGAAEDACGFWFRGTDDEGFYTVRVNREGSAWFSELVGEVWQDPIFGNGGALRTERADTNHLVLVAVGDRFVLFINGAYSGEFQDATFGRGGVAVLADTYDESDETGCTFTNAWVWDLVGRHGPTAYLTLTPGASPSPTVAPSLQESATHTPTATVSPQ